MWSILSNSAIFLDVEAEILSGLIHYESYAKPGNACAYLPLGSFHVCSFFPVWIKAEQRQSCIEYWPARQKCSMRKAVSTFLF